MGCEDNVKSHEGICSIKWRVWAPVDQVYEGGILNNSAFCFLLETKETTLVCNFPFIL